MNNYHNVGDSNRSANVSLQFEHVIVVLFWSSSAVNLKTHTWYFWNNTVKVIKMIRLTRPSVTESGSAAISRMSKDPRGSCFSNWHTDIISLYIICGKLLTQWHKHRVSIFHVEIWYDTVKLTLFGLLCLQLIGQSHCRIQTGAGCSKDFSVCIWCTCSP